MINKKDYRLFNPFRTDIVGVKLSSTVDSGGMGMVTLFNHYEWGCAMSFPWYPVLVGSIYSYRLISLMKGYRKDFATFLKTRNFVKRLRA